jgi:hypothetical protein
MTADEAEQHVYELYEVQKDNKYFQHHPAFKNKASVIAERREDALKMNHPFLAIVNKEGIYEEYKN